MRFAILTHDHPFLHWDLLLECGESCRSWRLLSSPDTPGPISAETLPDHRVFYLDYEGPVTGNRGTVTQWDRGTCVWITNRSDRVRVQCHGTKWRGTVTLVATADGWLANLTSPDR